MAVVYSIVTYFIYSEREAEAMNRNSRIEIIELFFPNSSRMLVLPANRSLNHSQIYN